MKIQHLILTFVFLTVLFACKKEWNEVAISSPDSKLQLIFNINKGRPTYKLNLNGKPILLESQMGFRLKDMPAFDSNFVLVDRKINSSNRSWEQPWGEVKKITNNYNEVILFLKEINGQERKLNITFRLYNGGMGFRYEFPVQDHLDEFQITEELTNFTLAHEEEAWWIPAYRRERYE
ncbi:MAG: glycoside hydrolase family 97 N-terminal domain-containing protein, partial [Bacteroidales bacterium]